MNDERKDKTTDRVRKEKEAFLSWSSRQREALEYAAKTVLEAAFTYLLAVDSNEYLAFYSEIS